MSRVSTIIPTYNRERYVGQAVESVLRQTMPDVEVIVVDDGSVDKTGDVVRGYCERVRYVRTENRGPAHARNVGMKMATGEYISFLDSDDTYIPEKCELQAKVLDAFPDIAMVSSELSGFDDGSYWEEFHLRTYHRSGFGGADQSFDGIYEERFKLKNLGLAPKRYEESCVYLGSIFKTYFHRMVICTNTMMFRRRILDEIGFQNEGLRLLEEHNFALRIAKHYRVAFVDVPTYRLRYHAQQMSDVSRGPSRLDGLGIVIEKQRNMLRTAVELGRDDEEYYAANRLFVDRRIADLHKALAIPLMCTVSGAAEARKLLLGCPGMGVTELLLALATLLPRMGRKASARMATLLQG